MMPFPIPENEAERLNAVEAYQLTGLFSAEELKDIATISAAICETPIASVTVIDKEIQHFVAEVGIGVPGIPRQFAFCTFAIAEGSFIEVEDLSKDDRFNQNPLVAGEQSLRFYAGVPLVNSEGYALGSLCVLDKQPRTLTKLQRQSIISLGKQAMLLFELRMKNILLKQSEKELHAYAHQMENFAKVASHDLREPLRTIRNFTGLLQKEYADKLDAKATKYIGFAHNSAEKMSALVNDLLQYACLRKEDNKIVEVDLNLVLQEIIILKAGSFDAFEISLNYMALPVFRGYRIPLTTLFINLITNAIKYRSESQRLSIAITCEIKEDCYEFCIADNGVGIPAEFLSEVFEPFSRGDGLQNIEGTGLGLAICKNIVLLHGGSIWVKSKVGKGTSFYFTIAI